MSCCNIPMVDFHGCEEDPELRFESGSTVRDLDRLLGALSLYIEDLIDQALGIYSRERSEQRRLVAYVKALVDDGIVGGFTLAMCEDSFNLGLPISLEESPVEEDGILVMYKGRIEITLVAGGKLVSEYKKR